MGNSRRPRPTPKSSFLPKKRSHFAQSILQSEAGTRLPPFGTVRGYLEHLEREGKHLPLSSIKLERGRAGGRGLSPHRSAILAASPSGLSPPPEGPLEPSLGVDCVPRCSRTPLPVPPCWCLPAPCSLQLQPWQQKEQEGREAGLATGCVLAGVHLQLCM